MAGSRSTRQISALDRFSESLTYNRDSSKFGGRDRGGGGPYGREGALRCGCAGSGVGSRDEGQGLDARCSLANCLWRPVLALGWKRSISPGGCFGGLVSEELALEDPALEGPASGACCGGIEVLGILNEEFGRPLSGG